MKNLKIWHLALFTVVAFFLMVKFVPDVDNARVPYAVAIVVIDVVLYAVAQKKNKA